MSETIVKQGPATWRIILAFFLDLITAFFVLGYVVGALMGGLTEDGFQLSGMPALVLFALIIVYYIVFNRYLGGTVWKHILRAKR